MHLAVLDLGFFLELLLRLLVGFLRLGQLSGFFSLFLQGANPIQKRLSLLLFCRFKIGVQVDAVHRLRNEGLGPVDVVLLERLLPLFKLP